MNDFAPDPSFSPQPTPVLPSTTHRIFFGQDGLRAGWSLLIAVALFSTLFPVANTLAHKTHLIPPHALERAPSPIPVLISEGLAFLVTLLVTWIMSKIERRPLSVYGLGGLYRSGFKANNSRALGFWSAAVLVSFGLDRKSVV